MGWDFWGKFFRAKISMPSLGSSLSEMAGTVVVQYWVCVLDMSLSQQSVVSRSRFDASCVVGYWVGTDTSVTG